MKIYGKKYWRNLSIEIDNDYVDGWGTLAMHIARQRALLRRIREWKEQKHETRSS